jgi:transposase, IS6 family
MPTTAAVRGTLLAVPGMLRSSCRDASTKIELCWVPLSQDVIMIAMRWYLRFGLSPDVEKLLAERGVEVDQVTIYRWVQRFTSLLVDAARPCRHAPGDRWFVDET